MTHPPPSAWIDRAALEAAREIEGLPEEWPRARWIAAIQVIVAKAMQRAAPSFPAQSTPDADGLRIGLLAIKSIVQSWLDWHRKHRDKELLVTDGDTSIMALPVPMWPSHAQFEHWIKLFDDAAYKLTPGIASLSPQESKLRLFLAILSKAGGETSGSDSKWNWVNYFCDDAEPLDTFNQASKRKLTRVTHDSDTDESMVYLTDAGRAFLAADHSQEASGT